MEREKDEIREDEFCRLKLVLIANRIAVQIHLHNVQQFTNKGRTRVLLIEIKLKQN